MIASCLSHPAHHQAVWRHPVHHHFRVVLDRLPRRLSTQGMTLLVHKDSLVTSGEQESQRIAVGSPLHLSRLWRVISIVRHSARETPIATSSRGSGAWPTSTVPRPMPRQLLPSPTPSCPSGRPVTPPMWSACYCHHLPCGGAIIVAPFLGNIPPPPPPLPCGGVMNGHSAMATNVTSLLSSAVSSFNTDTIYSIVGATASLLTTTSTSSDGSSSSAASTAAADSLRTSLLSAVLSASSLQVAGFIPSSVVTALPQVAKSQC